LGDIVAKVPTTHTITKGYLIRVPIVTSIN
jgi:hypothetical protein